MWVLCCNDDSRIIIKKVVMMKNNMLRASEPPIISSFFLLLLIPTKMSSRNQCSFPLIKASCLLPFCCSISFLGFFLLVLVMYVMCAIEDLKLKTVSLMLLQGTPEPGSCGCKLGLSFLYCSYTLISSHI
ncbi:hypothetical protein AAHE18_19G119500 [Arachis hypogaea]